MFSKMGVCVLFLLGIVFVLWNIVGEYYVLQSVSVAAAFTLAWLVAPSVVMLLTVLSKKDERIREYFWLSLVYAIIFAIFAFDGSTKGRDGAEHLHLVLVPPLTWLILVVLGVLRIYERLKRGVVTKRQSGSV